jgi:hypothetical protein
MSTNAGMFFAVALAEPNIYHVMDALGAWRLTRRSRVLTATTAMSFALAWKMSKHRGGAIRPLNPSLIEAKLRRAVGDRAGCCGENSVASRSPWKKERCATEFARRMKHQEPVQTCQGRGRLCEPKSFGRFGYAVSETGMHFGGVGVGSSQREHDVGSVGPVRYGDVFSALRLYGVEVLRSEEGVEARGACSG